jgi:hypothetical protein
MVTVNSKDATQQLASRIRLHDRRRSRHNHRNRNSRRISAAEEIKKQIERKKSLFPFLVLFVDK